VTSEENVGCYFFRGEEGGEGCSGMLKIRISTSSDSVEKKITLLGKEKKVPRKSSKERSSRSN
jgi:hypothetical protein